MFSKGVYPSVLLKNFNSVDISRFLSFYIGVKISLLYKRMGDQLILENFCTKVGLKLLLRIPNILENFDFF